MRVRGRVRVSVRVRVRVRVKVVKGSFCGACDDSHCSGYFLTFFVFFSGRETNGVVVNWNMFVC